MRDWEGTPLRNSSAPQEVPESLCSTSVASISRTANHPLRQPKTALIVAGMHGSGASALARVLSLMGCDLPKTAAAEPWESHTITDFDDTLLASAGSAWNDWLAFNMGWYRSPKAQQFEERALALLTEEFGTSRLFVVEDPRLCRLLPFWRDVLDQAGIEPAIIVPIRSPLEVAASLAQRDGLDPEFCHLLWLRHMLDAEAGSRGLKRFFCTYDDLINCWPRLISRVQDAIETTFPRHANRAAEEVDAFLDGRPRLSREADKAVIDNPALSSWLRYTFEIFVRWAEAGESDSDYTKLDQVRSELNAAAPAFSRLVASGERAARKVRALEQDIVHLNAKRDASADSFLSPPSFWRPEYLEPSAWIEHSPFAFWLVSTLKPNSFVELGVHAGCSYFAVCQTVKAQGLATQCCGVDHWKGDEHSGFYDEEVYGRVAQHNAKHYADFSRLLSLNFDDAVSLFPDASIDLLHIDGRHFYEDVVHDFATWRPKLSSRAVVLFHDTRVLDRGFGVYRLWEELAALHPHFEFHHGYGLGVLGYGPNLPANVLAFFRATKDTGIASNVRHAYERLGHASAVELDALRSNAEAERLNGKAAEADGLQTQVVQLRAQLEDAAVLKREFDEARALIGTLERELTERTTALSRLGEEHEVLAEAHATSQLGLSESRSQLSRAESEAAQARHEANEAAAELDVARGRLAESEQVLADLAAERDTLFEAAQATEQTLDATQARLARTESTLLEQCRAADETIAELAATAERLSRAEAEAADQEREFGRAIVETNEKLAAKEQETAAKQLELEKAGARLNECFNEIATLTQLLLEQEGDARRLAEQAEWLRRTAAVLLRSGSGWRGFLYSLLPGALTQIWVMRQLKTANLFCAESYLSAHPDVPRSNVNALRHYVNHGMVEGRLRPSMPTSCNIP